MFPRKGIPTPRRGHRYFLKLQLVFCLPREILDLLHFFLLSWQMMGLGSFRQLRIKSYLQSRKATWAGGKPANPRLHFFLSPASRSN